MVSINVFLDRTEGFHLQLDVPKPMIFVSAGTGYDVRPFLQNSIDVCQYNNEPACALPRSRYHPTRRL
ncbi:MAG: hypothetical protein DLM70_17550 [Chloroflexi bacterium]|nr:MAG: hypothetical protein DLM70_17550 [Chloroflexota bacterium]